MVVMSLLHNQVCTGFSEPVYLCNSLRIFELGGHQARMCRAGSLLAGLERRCRQTAWGGGGLDSNISLVLWRAGQTNRKCIMSSVVEWHSLQVGDLSPPLNLEASHSSPSQPLVGEFWSSSAGALSVPLLMSLVDQPICRHKLSRENKAFFCKSMSS